MYLVSVNVHRLLWDPDGSRHSVGCNLDPRKRRGGLVPLFPSTTPGTSDPRSRWIVLDLSHTRCLPYLSLFPSLWVSERRGTTSEGNTSGHPQDPVRQYPR